MNLFHIHNHKTPIASKYVSFNTRKIVYQCKCGHKIVKEIYRPTDVPFPIETTPLMTNKELEELLKKDLVV